MSDPIPTPAAAESERILREALNEVAHTLRADQPAIVDTVWLDSVCPETLLDFVETALERAAITAQPAPDDTPAPRQDEPQLSREEAALERLQAIIDWCDFAMANPQEFNSHGVRNLDGPIFDKARILLDEATAPRHDAHQPRQNNVERVAAAFGAEMYGDQRPWGSFDGREQDALTRGAVAAIAAIATPAPRQDDELAYWKRQAERCAADNVALARLRDEAETKLATLAAGSEPVAWRCRSNHWLPESNWQLWNAEPDRTDLEHCYDIVEPLYATPTPALAPAAGSEPVAWRSIETARMDGTSMFIWHRMWECGPQIGYYDEATAWWRIGDRKHWLGVGMFPSHWHPTPEAPRHDVATPTPALAPQGEGLRAAAQRRVTHTMIRAAREEFWRNDDLEQALFAAEMVREPDLLPGLKRSTEIVHNLRDRERLSAEIARIEGEKP